MIQAYLKSMHSSSLFDENAFEKGCRVFRFVVQYLSKLQDRGITKCQKLWPLMLVVRR